MYEEHIASFIVQCNPCRLDEVIQLIQQPGDCEVTHVDPGSGKIVVVLVATDQHAISDFCRKVFDTSGVYSINLIYHHCEPLVDLDELVVQPEAAERRAVLP